jgi:hypothetical protein
LLTVSYRPGTLVTSEEGKILQQSVWKEIIEELSGKVPAVKYLVGKKS